MTEPERWLTDASAPAGMSDMLRAAKGVGPSAAESAKLGASLGISGASIWWSPLAKFIGTGVVLVGGGVGVQYWAGTHQVPSDASSQVQSQNHSSSDLGAQDERETASPLNAAIPNAATAPDQRLAEESRELGADNRPEASPVKRTSVPSEAQILAEAKAQLTVNPDRSLALLGRHRALYPHGVLAEERDVLKVRALREAGKLRAAEKLEADFREAHPESVHNVAAQK